MTQSDPDRRFKMTVPTDIPKEELACRRAFEEWCRSIGRPGKLGKPDTQWHEDAYAGWKACWVHLHK